MIASVGKFGSNFGNGKVGVFARIASGKVSWQGE
jgi:hypothetical protein